MADIEEWDPFREMKKARSLFDGWFLNFPSEVRGTGARKPLIDITDKGKEIEVNAEIPGVKKEDIDLSINEESIEIATKASVESEEQKKDYYYHERAFSSFRRKMPLPVEVVPSKAKAEFKNGILSVSIPKKKQEAKKKGVKVKVE